MTLTFVQSFLVPQSVFFSELSAVPYIMQWKHTFDFLKEKLKQDFLKMGSVPVKRSCK